MRIELRCKEERQRSKIIRLHSQYVLTESKSSNSRSYAKNALDTLLKDTKLKIKNKVRKNTTQSLTKNVVEINKRVSLEDRSRIIRANIELLIAKKEKKVRRALLTLKNQEQERSKIWSEEIWACYDFIKTLLRYIYSLMSMFLMKRLTELVLVSLLILILAPLFVSTAWRDAAAHVLNSTFKFICSMSINHYVCLLICILSSSSALYLSHCDESMFSQTFNDMWINVNDNFTHSVDASIHLHLISLRLLSYRERLHLLSSRYEREFVKTISTNNHLEIIMSIIEQFVDIFEETDSWFNNFLIELNSAVELFVHHNTYSLDFYRKSVSKTQSKKFSTFVMISSNLSQLMLTWDRIRPQTSIEKRLLDLLKSQIEIIEKFLFQLIALSERLVNVFFEMHAAMLRLKSLLSTEERTLIESKLIKLRILPLFVRDAMKMRASKPDDMNTLNVIYDLLLKTNDLVNNTLDYLRLLKEFFENFRFVLLVMRKYLKRNQRKYLRQANSTLLKRHFQNVNVIATRLREAKNRFDESKWW